MTITINKSESRGILAFIGVIALFAALALSGTSDYDEQVILHMSQTEYDEISNQLRQASGHEPSDHEIVQAFKKR